MRGKGRKDNAARYKKQVRKGERRGEERRGKKKKQIQCTKIGNMSVLEEGRKEGRKETGK